MWALYWHDHLAASRLTMLNATGHCPHLSAPAATMVTIKAFLAEWLAPRAYNKLQDR